MHRRRLSLDREQKSRDVGANTDSVRGSSVEIVAILLSSKCLKERLGDGSDDGNGDRNPCNWLSSG